MNKDFLVGICLFIFLSAVFVFLFGFEKGLENGYEHQPGYIWLKILRKDVLKSIIISLACSVIFFAFLFLKKG
jgi:hypothetical protein